MSGEKFWDKVAEKIGYDHSHINRSNSGQTGESYFKDMLVSRAANGNILDVGCSDGIFTCEIAKHAKNVIGIDNSEKMIEHARGKNVPGNVQFLIASIENTGLDNNTFDVVFSRRGPATSSKKSLDECYRVLKNGGFFIEITIGEKDCANLGSIFGRSQMKDRKNVSAEKAEMLKSVGFGEIAAQDFLYDEIFADINDLVGLLETTPIIPDFDKEGDKDKIDKLLELYGAKNIKVSRHRVVLCGEK